MTAPCTHPDNTVTTPHLIIERDNTIHGLGNNGTTIVRINHSNELPSDGLLPDTLLTNTPHVKTAKKYVSKRRESGTSRWRTLRNGNVTE